MTASSGASSKRVLQQPHGFGLFAGARLISASSRNARRIVRILGQRRFGPLLQHVELLELIEHQRRLRKDAAAVANQVSEHDVRIRGSTSVILPVAISISAIWPDVSGRK